MYRSVLGFLCAIGVASTAANATNLQTDAPAQASFTVVGFVPVTCRASLDATVETIIGGDVSLGKLNEFCNSAAGYDVFVESSPELAGAKLIVDGREVSLSPTGITLVVSNNGPAMVSRDVRLSGAFSTGGLLNFRVVVR